MPITYITMLIGGLANAGLPPFAGFFSKDRSSKRCTCRTRRAPLRLSDGGLLGVFVGGLYSFRLIFYAFHGKERFGAHDAGHGAAHDAHAMTTRSRP